MSKVDEELTRRFHRAERPVRDDGLFEGLARRRRRRRTLQRLQAGALAIVVVVGTVGGFVALREAFREDEEKDVGTAPLPANGQIVFSRALPDGSEHLFAVRPGEPGERLITSGSAVYTDPSVAPDGRAIAVVHSIPSFGDTNAEGVIATFTMDGGPPTWITDPLPRVGDPSWSPDGSRIAFAGATTAGGLPGIYVMDADGSDLHLVVELDGFNLSAPDWSPDGTMLVFVGLATATSEAEVPRPDLYTVRIDGSNIRNLTETPRVSEWSPSWSPDGDVIAFHWNEGNVVNKVQLIDLGGHLVGTVFDDSDVGEIGEVEFSPDGRFIAFTSELALTDSDNEGDLDVWTTRVDGTDLTNLTTEGASGISWQPIPAGSAPSVEPEPSASAPPEPEGVQVGLHFTLCESTRLSGIDFLGNGTSGYAWVGIPAREDGTCPRFPAAGAYVVAADADGDRVAETFTQLPWKCYVDCVPYDAADLDGNGTEELIVAGYFSIMDYYVMRYLGPPDEPSPVIVPILVAEPGHEPVGLRPGEPLRIDAGGDEGYGSQIECEGYPGAPVIVWSSSSGVVDSHRPKEIHIVRIQLQSDGLFHVVGASDYSVPADQPSGIDYTPAPACGVDWSF
jgi:WD40 repeat protein